jgi:hypothetical protein
LNVVVLPTANRTTFLKELYRLAENQGLDPQEIQQRCGIPLTRETEQLQVDIRQILSVLDIREPAFTDALYELEARLIHVETEAQDFQRSTTYVDGVRSELLTFSAEPDPEVGTLFYYQAVCYVADVDITYTFTFTDDLVDRDDLQRIAQQTLDTVRFWPSLTSAAHPDST